MFKSYVAFILYIYIYNTYIPFFFNIVVANIMQYENLSSVSQLKLIR